MDNLLFCGLVFGIWIAHILPTLPLVGGRFRFGALRATTALRGFFINNYFGVGPWKCGQSLPALSAVRRSGLGLPTFPQPHPVAANGGPVSEGASAAQAAVLRFCFGVSPPSDQWGLSVLKASAKASMQRFTFTRSS